MKFSYNWIREFVAALDTAGPPLERLITMKTAECEGIEDDRRAAGRRRAPRASKPSSRSPAATT